MWLLIFPEDTNLSPESLASSKKWAEKNDLHFSDLVLLPRARGLRACLEGLTDSVDWLYDCTIAYEAELHMFQILDLEYTLYSQGEDYPIAS